MTQSKQWFNLNPERYLSKELGLNKKYGQYDYSQDARKKYEKDVIGLVEGLTKKGKIDKVVLVGSNDGREATYFSRPEACFFGVDLAKGALQKIQKGVVPIYADAEHLPFIDNYFDAYMALRAIYSNHTDLRSCLLEARRVLKNQGTAIISIPNGYLIDGKIHNGMYNYNKKIIDTALPYNLSKKTKKLLTTLGFKNIREKVFLGEIFISAQKK